MLLIAGVAVVVLSALLTRLFIAVGQNTRLMDKPNERSLHSKPTVRGGGIVFIGLALFALPVLCYLNQISFTDQIILVVSIIMLAAVSFLDDLFQLSAKSRFLVQCLVALLIALFMRPENIDLGMFTISNAFLIVLFLFFAVIWAINHFNFMDGLDGFCASQALFLFSAYALLFGFHNAVLYQDFCFIFMCSLLGFLMFNFPPARLFMGDIGSASLGLITFTIGLIAEQKYQIPLFYWFALNSLFLFDATITLFRRVINKEKWSSPHRKHAYQRLKQSGMNTRFILFGQISVNIAILMLVLLFRADNIGLGVLLFSLLTLLITVYLLIEKLFPMYQLECQQTQA